MNKHTEEQLIEVYRAKGEMEALVIKSLLENCHIPCLLRSHASPSVHVFTMDGMGEVRVMVSKEQSVKAMELIVKKGNH